MELGRRSNSEYMVLHAMKEEKIFGDADLYTSSGSLIQQCAK